MRKVLLLLICTTVLWVPAASVAGDSSPSSLSKLAKTEAAHAKTDASSPASACKSHRSGGKVRGAGANAFGKCVSALGMHKAESDGNESAQSERKDSERKDSPESHDKNSANPAMTCKAMQANDLGLFQTAYGTRPNAFGKCVANRANSKKG